MQNIHYRSKISLKKKKSLYLLRGTCEAALQTAETCEAAKYGVRTENSFHWCHRYYGNSGGTATVGPYEQTDCVKDCLKEWAVIPGRQDFNGDLGLSLLRQKLKYISGSLASEPDPPLCSHGASARSKGRSRNVATQHN